MSTVYLIHLDCPIAHARHYLGYSSLEDVTSRLERHKKGNGARLLQVANERGITYSIVRTWDCEDWKSARKLERRLKRQNNSPRYCPVCNQAKVQSKDKENETQ